MSTGPDESDVTLLSQVDVAEIDAVLGAPIKVLAKDPTRLRHLLLRVRGTLLAAHETVRGMQRAMVEQQSYLARVGTPTTLNPLDAVRFLDDDQKELIFDRLSRERLKNLRTLVARTQEERAAVAQSLDAVRDVARTLSQSTDLPPHVRAEVTRMLAGLPLEAPKVHYPPILDYPDPEPLVRAPAHPQAAPHPGVPNSAAPVAQPPSSEAPAEPWPASTTPAPAFVDPYAAAPAFVDPYAAAPAAGVYSDPYAAQPQAAYHDPYSPEQGAAR